MLHDNLVAIIFSLVFLIFSAASIAQTEEEQQEESFKHPVEQLTGRVSSTPVYSHIYGADFMTEQERCNYLMKLDGIKTKEERDAYRAKHRQEIDLLRKGKGG